MSRKVAEDLAEAIVCNDYPPASFSKIGAGETRDVYLHVPSNLVYKIDTTHGEWYGYPVGNMVEWETYEWLRHRKLPRPFKLPRMWHYEVFGMHVIQTKYIEGEQVWCDECDPLIHASIDMLEKKWGIPDLDGNILRDQTGTHWIIDLGLKT